MGRDIPLGRLAGIKIGMNVSVLLIAGFNAWVLADNNFPIQVPGLTPVDYWVAGVTAALAFFASLLVHEMGHALVARHEGIGVSGISLWLLGGVARLESSPRTPGAEFRIAVVGPLASAACGVALVSAAYVLPDYGRWHLAGTAAEWLGVINLILAGFNLLPAAPLDGGSVLAALIWSRSGRQSTGKIWAARSGVAVGLAMVWWGLKDVGTNDGIGLWILMVGAFIAMNAWQSLRAAPLFALVEGVRVADAMYADPPTARASDTVADFLRSLPRDTHHQTYPVIGDHGRVTGVLTANAIRAVPSSQWEALRTVELAFPMERITVVRTDEPLLNAIQRIDGGDVRTGLVVDPGGRTVGTVDARALRDLADARRS